MLLGIFFLGVIAALAFILQAVSIIQISMLALGIIETIIIIAIICLVVRLFTR